MESHAALTVPVCTVITDVQTASNLIALNVWINVNAHLHKSEKLEMSDFKMHHSVVKGVESRPKCNPAMTMCSTSFKQQIIHQNCLQQWKKTFYFAHPLLSDSHLYVQCLLEKTQQKSREPSLTRLQWHFIIIRSGGFLGRCSWSSRRCSQKKYSPLSAGWWLTLQITVTSSASSLVFSFYSCGSRDKYNKMYCCLQA